MARRNPFGEIERVVDRMSQQLDDAARWWADENDLPGEWDTEAFSLDVIDADDEFIVTVDVPGFERTDLDIRIADHTLWIDGDTQDTIETTEDRYLRRERRRRSLRRSVRLPAAVDQEGVTARLHAGILTITIPKAEPAEDAHQIQIDAD